RAIVADSPLLLSSWAYNASLIWPDVEPARAFDLLSNGIERLNTTDSDETQETEDVTFNLLAWDDPVLTRIAQDIANQWSQYGLEIVVESQPEDMYKQRLIDADFDMAIVELPLHADPD